MANCFAGRVIEIGFKYDNRLSNWLVPSRMYRGRRGRFSDHAKNNAKNIRLGKILLAGPVADAVDRHRGKRTEALGEGGDDGGTGWRRELAFHVERGQRNAAEKLACGRRGNRAAPVGDFDKAVAGG